MVPDSATASIYIKKLTDTVPTDEFGEGDQEPMAKLKKKLDIK